MAEIDRSYYVYVHRDKETEDPFDIGKGKGKRAYATDKRSHAWRERVESLKQGYAVEFVKCDLVEAEAMALEDKWIDELGTVRDESGPLINELKPSETVIEITLTGPWAGSGGDFYEWEDEPEEYAGLKASLKRDFIVKLAENMKMFRKEFWRTRREVEAEGNEGVKDLEETIGNCIGMLNGTAKEWFAEECSLDDVAGEVEGQFDCIRKDIRFSGVLDELVPVTRMGLYAELAGRVATYLEMWLAELKAVR